MYHRSFDKESGVIRTLLIAFLASGVIGCASIRPQDIEGPLSIYLASEDAWEEAGVYRLPGGRPVIVMRGRAKAGPTDCAKTDHTRMLYVLLHDGSLKLKTGRLLRCDSEDAIEI